MAISWGSTVGNFRLGRERSGRTWRLYGQSVRYGHNWSYTITFSGGASGTKTGHFSSGHNQTKTVLLHTWEMPANQSYSWSARLNSALVNGATVTGSYTYTPPAPVPSKPALPTVSRTDDTRHIVYWSASGTWTGGEMQRETTGSGIRTIASLRGNPRSWTDTTTNANMQFRYRVRGRNATGFGAWSDWSAWCRTTPARPSGVQATKLANGDIRVSVSGLPPYAQSYDVFDEATNSIVGSSVQVPWVHTSPNQAVVHRYRVRASLRYQGASSALLTSAYSDWSNTVQLLAAPAAPTGLAPNGGLRVSDEDVRLEWLHNAVDSSEQTAFEVRYRELGGSWVTVSGGEDSFADLESEAGEYEWQVRTKGAHPSWSPWSSTATVEVIDRPGVAIVEPDGEESVGYSILNLEWSFFQAQDYPQSSWQAELLDADEDLLESHSGSGAGDVKRFTRRLVDGETYTVRVRAASGDVWSDWSEVTFTTDFPLPGEPDVNVSWDDERGSHMILFEDTAGDAETVELIVERSFDGESWVLVGDGFEPGENAVEDFEGVSNGVTFYRVTAVSGLPSTFEVVFEAQSDSGAVWLSGGDEFSVTCRLPYNPQPSRNTGRATSLREYSGRSKPVVYKGKQLSRVVDIAGDVLYDDDVNASYEELEELVHLPDELHLYRDPDGQRIYGALSEVSLSRQSHEHWSYSASITEADR